MPKLTSKLHKLRDAALGRDGQIAIPAALDRREIADYWDDLPLFVMQTGLHEATSVPEYLEVYEKKLADTIKKQKIVPPYQTFMVEFSSKGEDYFDAKAIDRFVVFVYVEDGQMNCIPCIETLDGDTRTDKGNIWMCAVSRYKVDLESCHVEIGTLPLDDKISDVDSEIKDVAEQTAKAAGWMATLLCMMMTTKDYDSEGVEAPAKLNRQRTLKGKSPLVRYDAITLKLPKRGSGSHGAVATGTGAKKKPHDRMEHVRRLRDGREIPVRAMKIHGGGDTAPQYTVIMSAPRHETH